MSGSRSEAEPRVETDVAENDDEIEPCRLAGRQAIAHQARADALVLVFRQNAHRRQPGASKGCWSLGNGDRREQDVSHDLIAVLCHERDDGFVSRPKPVDQRGFRRSTKGALVDFTDCPNIVGTFSSDFNHVLQKKKGRPIEAALILSVLLRALARVRSASFADFVVRG